MSESKAKELIKKRGSVKAKITQFSSYLNVVRSSAQLSELQITELTVRLSKIENLYSIYDTLQSDLEMIADDPDELYAEREQFESQYYNVTAAAQLLVEKHRASKPIQPEASSLDARTSVTNAQNYVRLPKIDLPHFCGDYHKWLEFRDTFNSLIHSNKDIDNINKFHYLRSSLQGSAALVIKNLDFTAKSCITFDSVGEGALKGSLTLPEFYWTMEVPRTLSHKISVDIKKQWSTFTHTLPALNNLNIPRWVTCDSAKYTQIHIFTDASESLRRVRLHTHSNMIQLRIKGETIQPIMGHLPAERTNLEFPFFDTGVDYAGPIMIADRKGRGCKLIKTYISVFVCLATRAVHLELVSDLTKEAFISALNRFIARRGKPRNIFSDNGTSFVGAFNELSNILKQDFSSHFTEGINFSFIPAYTPHFGGLWESAVKSIKYHLRRVLGLTHLTYDEMCTCLTQIEAILNSRPLTPLSIDTSDLTPLTPAHFLIGRSLTFVPYPQITEANVTNIRRLKRIEYIKQHFWKRFSKEYISCLQQKSKWCMQRGELTNGTMVLIKDSHAPPLMWLLGRIVRIIPGTDGIARVADIQTKKGVIRRAFNTICPLPISS
ncbi:hypothetical protein EVAR_77195_1 [Eumeta japonica]|uniref:Integrase catalytic domain-containing protein n=1 Tax=Eumeta variegata TaxID=151549 RepID=A0A4C1T2T3_EUMVA|nr:hypothetical protein EVAR_77195_1 [Eumeta japonica]